MIITFTNVIGAIRNAFSVVRSGLKMWLGFETSNIVGDKQITPDKSGNNNVGELFTGKALDFNGSTNYVNLGALSNPAINMTFACWLNPVVSASTSNQSIIDYGKFNVWLKNNDTLVVYTNSGGAAVNYAISDLNNKWSRLVVSVSVTTTSVYIDGILIDAKTTPALSAGANTSVIGREGTSKYYDGKLSDLQVYDKAWTQADVTFDYDNPQNLVTDRNNTTINLSNLKAYWAMSEGAGSVAYDSSGEGNNGTINGATYELTQPRIQQLGMMNFSNGAVATGVTLIPDPNNTSQDIDGNPVRDRLNSFNLDGKGYAEVVDDTDLDFGTGDFTLECWAKYDFLNQGSGFNVLVSNGDMGGSGSGFNLGSSSSRFDFRLLSSAITKNFGTDNMTVGNWYHLVVTRDGTTLNLYRDTAIKSSSTIASVDVDTSLPVRIGRDTNSDRFYQNLISDVRLYKGKALSSTEIENNYNAGLSAHTN